SLPRTFRSRTLPILARPGQDPRAKALDDLAKRDYLQKTLSENFGCGAPRGWDLRSGRAPRRGARWTPGTAGTPVLDRTTLTRPGQVLKDETCKETSSEDFPSQGRDRAAARRDR